MNKSHSNGNPSLMTDVFKFNVISNGKITDVVRDVDRDVECVYKLVGVKNNIPWVTFDLDDSVGGDCSNEGGRENVAYDEKNDGAMLRRKRGRPKTAAKYGVSGAGKDKEGTTKHADLANLDTIETIDSKMIREVMRKRKQSLIRKAEAKENPATDAVIREICDVVLLRYPNKADFINRLISLTDELCREARIESRIEAIEDEIASIDAEMEKWRSAGSRVKEQFSLDISMYPLTEGAIDEMRRRKDAIDGISNEIEELERSIEVSIKSEIKRAEERREKCERLFRDILRINTGSRYDTKVLCKAMCDMDE